jgi:hypothetical protein
MLLNTIGNKEKRMTETKTNASEVKTRNKRRPFNAPTSKLSVDKQLEGWKYRWVNDEPGRIAKAQAGDYVFAEPEEVGREKTSDNRVRELAGTLKDGSAMYTYLMRIPMEYYLEDRQASQAHLDQIDNAIKGGKTTPITNGYIPEGGISIKTK